MIKRLKMGSVQRCAYQTKVGGPYLNRIYRSGKVAHDGPHFHINKSATTFSGFTADNRC